MRKVYREYTNGEITVEWRSDLCNHSGICINDLPSVFNLLQIPWVDMKGASTEEIIKVVDDCPTRALQWRYNQGELKEGHAPAGEAQVVLVAEGPIVVRGKLKIKTESGEILQKEGAISLCRCGLSKKMPWCDGEHFKAPKKT